MKLLVTVLILLGSSSSWGMSKCEENYVPPHTFQDLQEVKAWATGGAFYFYAKQAGYSFNKKAYNEDNPYLALFNFGRATGTTCLEIDVLNGYISMSWAFQSLTIKMNDPDVTMEKTFQEIYTEQALALGMDVYLTKLPEASDLVASNN